MAGALDFLLNLRANTTGLQRGMDGAKFAVNALVAAMAAVGVGLSVKALADAADSYTNLSARINIATKDGGDFTSAMAGVHQVALMTNTSLDATGSLFTRLNTVGKEMGMTQQNTLDLTKTINQAIQTSGGTAEASEAAITQLIQAMQGGVLRGEEFNSIMENGYGVAEALAEGLGVTTGELRKMAENGELSAERVYKALLSQKDAVQATYDQFPITISNALQRIQTQWQILIGEMNNATGASSVVAEALLVIADNLGILKVFIDDIGEGFSWIGSKLTSIDATTIETLKSVLSEAYDTVKSLISNIATLGETVRSASTTALDAVSPLFAALLSGKDEVSGLEVALNLLRMAFATISDIAFGFNIGLKLLLSGIQFLSGGLYALSSQILGFLGFETLADQAGKASDRMFAQAEKNIGEVKKLSEEHEWAVVKTYKKIGETQEESNQRQLTESQKTLDQLKAQEESHIASYKALNNERIQAEQQLYEARKSGNQAAIDLALKGLAEVEGKEKAYQAESQKITDAKIQAAQIVANAMIQSADAAGIAQLKVLNAQLAAQGLQAEFDSTGKVIVKAMDDGAKAIEGQSNATDKARKAAVALGLDLDVSLNRVSSKFIETEGQLNNFVDGLEGLGVTGEQAGEVTYQAWLKWLETAKSQAEIDAANAKLQEFEAQGVFSTKQVELGMQAIQRATAKLPDDLDEVGAAFERLGIKTKEQLRLSAQMALSDFDVVRQSGQATQADLQKAYEKTIQLAYASGDAQSIAAANAKAASLGLSVQVNETGQVSVKAMDEWSKSNDRVRNSAERIGDGYRDAGRVAREEAQSVKSEWEQAIDAAQASTDKFRAEMKRQGESLSKGIYDYSSYSKADVLSQLKSKGYSDKEAEKLAGSIWSEAMAADRDAKAEGLGKGGNPAMKALINQEFDAAAAKGLTTQWGTNKINDLLRQVSSDNLVSIGPSTKPVDVNSLAPNVSTPVPSTPTANASKSVNYNISFGGQTLSLSGSAEQESMMNQLIKQLKTQAKST
ncbi:tape measure protein [Acinetobacter albensis]|uniref:tape measure protein n=1 Tax=Acinetobacter albensis TaxID=1673609 RepID=UPI00187EA650|nr:tape measure protein [Acinetobacter albensis]MBE9400955.1 tape measure protein [Acinetobacter albensis]